MQKSIPFLWFVINELQKKNHNYFKFLDDQSLIYQKSSQWLMPSQDNYDNYSNTKIPQKINDMNIELITSNYYRLIY